MGRPPITDEPRVATAIRLPESLHARLHAVARERDVSANLLVTHALRSYLDGLAPLDEALAVARPTPPGRRPARKTSGR